MTAHLSTACLASTEQARLPWLLPVDGIPLTVRGAHSQDLPAVALMHGRCSAKSLLDRYRSGGRAPAIIVLDRQVRDRLSFVVTAEDGRVVATARAVTDALHPLGSAEISILVEDDWQRLGIGRALLRHTASAAVLAGFRQVIAYPGTTTGTIQRLMSGIGTTRLITDGQRHLHTFLSGHARLGPSGPRAATRTVRALGC